MNERLEVVMKVVHDNFSHPKGQEPSILNMESYYWRGICVGNILFAFYFIKLYADHANILVLFDGYDGGKYDLFIILTLFLSASVCFLQFIISHRYLREKFMGRTRLLYFINCVSSGIMIITFSLASYSLATKNIHVDHFFKVMSFK